MKKNKKDPNLEKGRKIMMYNEYKKEIGNILDKFDRRIRVLESRPPQKIIRERSGSNTNLSLNGKLSLLDSFIKMPLSLFGKKKREEEEEKKSLLQVLNDFDRRLTKIENKLKK